MCELGDPGDPAGHAPAGDAATQRQHAAQQSPLTPQNKTRKTNVIIYFSSGRQSAAHAPYNARLPPLASQGPRTRLPGSQPRKVGWAGLTVRRKVCLVPKDS